MITQIAFRKPPLQLNFLLPVALFILFFVLHKPGYFLIRDPFFWLGLLFLPLSLQLKEEQGGKRYFYWALLCGLLSIPFTSTFGIYCMLVFSLLFLLEKFSGKTSILAAFHLLLLSPLFQYLSKLISFPIRLALSEASGGIMAFAGFDISVSGNLIRLNGTDFLVDNACSGLFMLRYSFLFALLMLAYFQGEGKSWRLQELAFLLPLLLPLNILSNLIRIVILVVFRIMPEHWFHEVLGLIIFFLYSLLPFFFITRYLAGKGKRANIPQTVIPKAKPAQKVPAYLPLALLLAGFGFLCWKNSHKSNLMLNTHILSTTAYQTEMVREVYKLSSAQALIYIKPPVEAYNADHNPLICWQGSGYEFRHIRSTKLGQLEVSLAELRKEGQSLYTMWWYDSGSLRTCSQWQWRWQSLTQQEAFYLVNITAENLETLEAEAQTFLRRKIIQ